MVMPVLTRRRTSDIGPKPDNASTTLFKSSGPHWLTDATPTDSVPAIQLGRMSAARPMRWVGVPVEAASRTSRVASAESVESQMSSLSVVIATS